jgi:hypothetical protein
LRRLLRRLRAITGSLGLRFSRRLGDLRLECGIEYERKMGFPGYREVGLGVVDCVAGLRNGYDALLLATSESSSMSSTSMPLTTSGRLLISTLKVATWRIGDACGLWAILCWDIHEKAGQVR